MESKQQCDTCKHNAQISSCGPCIDKGSQMISKIAIDLGAEISNPEDTTNKYKYSCKIIMKYPEDFNEIDPYNCKYYLNSCLGFR